MRKFIASVAIGLYISFGIFIATDANEHSMAYCGRTTSITDVAATSVLWLPLLGVYAVTGNNPLPDACDRHA